MALSDAGLSEDQRQVLQLILGFFAENRDWPTYRWLNQLVFRERDQDLDDIVAGIPVGHLLPEPSARHPGGVTPGTQLSLTLRGVAALGADRELEVFLATIRHVGKMAAEFLPPREGSQDLVVTSSEVADAIACEESDWALALARELIVNSIWEIWSGTGVSSDGTWQMSCVPEKARKYRSAGSVQELLREHEPRERQRQAWSASPTVLGSTSESSLPGLASTGSEAAQRTVFVVYGRNAPARLATFSFLEALGLEPMSWDKLLAATGQPSPYIGDVLEAGLPGVQAVVVLLTPDDVARARPAFLENRDPPHERELTPQARPNVLFEAGMALAHHPDSTVFVELGELRPFSDIAGRHMLRMDDSIATRESLITRLRTAGCPVTPGGDAWRTAGDFTSALQLASSAGGSPTDEAPEQAAVRFALVEDPLNANPDTGAVTLRVENEGDSDEFEATVVEVRGWQAARPPWYVRWRNSASRGQEILTGHSWVLDLCDVLPPASAAGVPGWRFLSPDRGTPLELDREAGHEGWPAAMRVTVQVTPRTRPRLSLRSTVTLSLTDRGRLAVWDKPRVES